MPNPMYARGVRFERELKKAWEDNRYTVIRASGSHGIYDLVCIPENNRSSIYGIQCKVTKTEKRAKQLTDAFQKKPPLPIGTCIQILSVKVLGQGLKVEAIV